MAKSCKKMWRCLIGIAFTTCGISKILGIAPQKKRFAAIGWNKKNMQTIGTAQVIGASMLPCRKTAKLGSLLITASSLCLLITNIKHKEKKGIIIDSVATLAAISTFCIKSNKS